MSSDRNWCKIANIAPDVVKQFHNMFKDILDINTAQFNDKLRQNMFLRNLHGAETLAWDNQRIVKACSHMDLFRDICKEWLNSSHLGAWWVEVRGSDTIEPQLKTIPSRTAPARTCEAIQHAASQLGQAAGSSKAGVFPIATQRAQHQADIGIVLQSSSKAKVGEFPPLPRQMPAEQVNPRLVDARIEVVSFGIHFIGDNICSCAKQPVLKAQIEERVANGRSSLSVTEAKDVLAASIGFDSAVEALAAGTSIIALNCKQFRDPEIGKRKRYPNHLGFHGTVLASVTSHPRFNSWFSDALGLVWRAKTAASQKQIVPRIVVGCFCNKGRHRSVPQLPHVWLLLFSTLWQYALLCLVYVLSPTTSIPKAKVACALLLAHAIEQVLFDGVCAREHWASSSWPVDTCNVCSECRGGASSKEKAKYYQTAVRLAEVWQAKQS